MTRSWLRRQVSSVLGQPTVLGSGSTALLAWHVAAEPVVSTAEAVALVDSGPWATASVLPALRALDVPAAYRQSFNSRQYPVAPATLPRENWLPSRRTTPLAMLNWPV